jgi:hypothetical protein
MKNIVFGFILGGLISACSQQPPAETYQSFGEEINAEAVKPISSVADLNEGDSVEVKLEGVISEVCQMKGCWMTLENEATPVRVTFKDYGFFVPKDASGKKTIIRGVATKTTLSEESARHYAEDAGVAYDSTRTYTEIAFVADGVLIEAPEEEQGT